MMSTQTVVAVLLAIVSLTTATVYFEEKFDSPTWSERWVQSKHGEFGKFDWTAGKFYGDDLKDKGLKTSEDARFYGVSAKFADNKFSNEGKDLIVQFSVKHEQNIDCGGGYIKVFDCSLDQEDLHGESPYLLMFGPDICGSATKKVHAIFNYKGKNLLINKEVRCKDDVHTHVYRWTVKPDNTYSISIDGEVVEKGELEKDWSFLPPSKIKDPEAKKPEDWDDRAKIDDPKDEKPEDWDKPEYIPDPEASKPEDWDDEMDGEWEPPQINNPEYKGEWKPRQIDNPAYKGEWVHPEVDNPEYKPDNKLYKYDEVCAVGFDLWQVKAGTIFDNVLIGDDVAEADAALNDILERVKDEKKMKEKLDEEERKANEAAEEDKKDKELDKEEEEEEEDNEIEDKDDDKSHDEL